MSGKPIRTTFGRKIGDFFPCLATWWWTEWKARSGLLAIKCWHLKSAHDQLVSIQTAAGLIFFMGWERVDSSAGQNLISGQKFCPETLAYFSGQNFWTKLKVKLCQKFCPEILAYFSGQNFWPVISETFFQNIFHFSEHFQGIILRHFSGQKLHS